MFPKDLKLKLMLPLFHLLLFIQAISAAGPVDSLYTAYRGAKGGAKVETANRFFEVVHEDGLADSLYRFSVSDDPKDVEARVIYWMAEYAYDRSRYDESVGLAEEALEMLRKNNDEIIISDCLGLLGVANLRTGNFPAALDYMEQGYRIDLNMGDKERLSSALNNLSSAYLAARQPEAAEKYILQAIETERTLDRPASLAVRLGMAAEIYLALEKPETALPLIEEAYKLDMEGGREGKAAVRLSQMAAVYMNLDRYGEARRCLLEAVPVFEKTGNLNSLSISYNQLGMLAYYEKNYGEAAGYFDKTVVLTGKTGNRIIRNRAYEGLYRSYRNVDAAKALHSLELLKTLSDSIYQEQSARQLSDFHAKYETAEKEHKIQLQQEEIRNRRIWQAFLAAAVLLCAAALALLWRILTLRRKRNAELEETNLLKDRFLSLLSHDLKNPVTAQRNALHQLEEYVVKFGDEGLARQSALLSRSADAQADLLSNLLLWGQVHTGRIPYNPVCFELAAVVSDAAELMRIQLKEKELVLDVDIAAGCRVSADRRMAETVIRNLLSNAVKFSPAGGRISVRAEAVSGGVNITVTNSGAGIPAEQMDAIGKFGQNISTPGTAGEQGSGMGLVVCAQLLEYEGSRLRITSGESEGTEVSFLLKSC